MRITCFLAFIWGLLLALFLQTTRLGAFLADKRTWVAVVIGAGVNLLIARRRLTWSQVAQVSAIFGASSVPIITRSLINEFSGHQEIIDAITQAPGQ